MPQLDPSIFATQVFWLVLTFVPLYVILRRSVLPRIGEVLAARRRHIDDDLEKASNLKAEADKVLAEYEKTLAAARGEASEALKQESAKMADESARRHEAFARQLALKVREAEERIAKAKAEALAQVTAVATDAAAAATVKLIGAEVPAEQARRAVDAAMEGRG